MSVSEKLVKTKSFMQTVFLHDEYYVDAILASFASRSNLCLLGFRGSGKTHAMECLCKMIDKSCVATQQGYLSAELEDVFARPDIPSLMRGEEKVVWKDMVTARVKAFDEIQRLGVGALSAMFRLMTSGTVMYFDQEAGVKEFWVITTANPTELSEDSLNVRLPEPLWDRFDAVCWIPIAPLKYQIKINGRVEKAKEALPVIWKEQDLLTLWKEVSSVEVDDRIEYVITLINRILGFCRKAQNYDASSLTEQQKRELCSQCNTSYVCAQIARPPSVRAKLALTKLAKGFAYLRGSRRVELIDIEKAFPLVYWKRTVLMDESQVANRLERLQRLARELMTEIREVKKPMDLVEELKNKFDLNKYRELERWVNSKIWLTEVKEDLDAYYESLRQQLKAKMKGADVETRYKIYMLAKLKLPTDMAREFELCESVEIELTNENLAKLATIDARVFKMAKEAMEKGEKKYLLTGEYAFKWILKK
jgi:MoxR-like ATPase